MFKEEKEIKSIDEVQETGIKYWFVDSEGSRTGQWVWIEKREDWYDSDKVIYTLNRDMFPNSHTLYKFECAGDYVRSWKTKNGAIRFFKRMYGHLIK